jgi:hypothetical protein
MMGGGMRGGWGGGPGPRPLSSGGPPASRPPPFDLTLCEPMFPKAHETDETAMTQVCVFCVDRYLIVLYPVLGGTFRPE